MTFKYCLFILFYCVITKTQSQSNDCNKLPFYPADHIRNPSLEQVDGSCQSKLYTDATPSRIQMKSVIPFWQSPISNYGSVEYFGNCNNFYHPVDPIMEADPSYIVYRLPLVPQPIPSGKGVIGIRSQRSISGTLFEESQTFKSYISTNLTRTLKRDSLYKLDFAIAFGNRDVSGEGFVISGSPTKFTLFGFLDSTKIPMLNPKPNGLLGCLSQNVSGWVALGSVTVSGDKGTWQRAVIEFVSSGAFQTIALGSSCDLSDVPYTTRAINESIDYYFIDDLKFYQASAPKPRLSKIAGNSCESESTTLRLQSNDYYNGSVFQWYKNNTPLPENNVSITTSSSSYGTGWYKMRVQNDSVCAMSDSIFLEWVPRIVDPYLGRKDTTLCIGETIELKIRAGTNASYLWSTGSTDSAIIVTQTGTYSVKVSNACNTLNALKTILYKDCPPTVFVPTAITPNGDGLNDIFRVSFSGRMKSFNLTVYDWFGQRIFHSTDPSKGWDGKVKGQIQNAALFVWKLQYTDGSDKTVLQKGTLALIK